MKKMIFGIALLALGLVSSLSTETTAQGYGGVCCQRTTGGCLHPAGAWFTYAAWVGEASTCTGHEEQSE